MVKPTEKAPKLEVKTVDGETFNLDDSEDGKFTLVVFYRGYHCPVCKNYSADLEDKLDDFKDSGVGDIIMVSGDDEERAKKTKEEWGLDKVKIGYGQSVDNMRDWGLFVSKSIKEGEPDEFGEPGLFLIKNDDHTVFYEAVNSMPFGRPKFEEILNGVRFVQKMDYPARGEA